MATCQRIVERHGGRLLVEAALDKGASFPVELPQGVVDPLGPPVGGVAAASAGRPAGRAPAGAPEDGA